jgi:hypothetical protein
MDRPVLDIGCGMVTGEAVVCIGGRRQIVDFISGRYSYVKAIRFERRAIKLEGVLSWLVCLSDTNRFYPITRGRTRTKFPAALA